MLYATSHFVVQSFNLALVIFITRTYIYKHMYKYMQIHIYTYTDTHIHICMSIVASRHCQLLSSVFWLPLQWRSVCLCRFCTIAFWLCLSCSFVVVFAFFVDFYFICFFIHAFCLCVVVFFAACGHIICIIIE